MEKFTPPGPPPQPIPKPNDVTIAHIMWANDRFFALGSDERVYVYNLGTFTWFLVQPM